MPLFEDDALAGAIRKATAGLGRQRKQDEELRMNQGFGIFPLGSRIPGTARQNLSSVEEAVRVAGRGFETLGRKFYPEKTELYDRGIFQDNLMIPELSASIYATGSEGQPLRYGFSNFVAGISDGRGGGHVPFATRSTTVAYVHCHWVNTRPSGSDSFGQRGISEDREADTYVAREYRREFGNRIRFFIYQWAGRWEEY